MSKETLGEKWVRLKTYQNECFGLDEKMGNVEWPQRLSKKDALIYYNNKFRNYFAEQATERDFDTIEDYYDFHDANRLLNAFYVKRDGLCTT